MSDGSEVVVVYLKGGEYAVVPVTVENAPPSISYGGRKIGTGNQLQADANDFPTLARTGLHSPEELNRTERITGKPIEVITAIGRPGSSSGEGFLAADEDILSVLRGDNRLVQRLGLTHPEMAQPLFHIWNLILKEYELGRVGRRYDNLQYALYNGKKVRFGEVHPTRGFQESIFNDEIMGAFDISLFRDLDGSERAFLDRKYPNLNEGQMVELVSRLSRIRTGEMESYYVMRYGFYEGHTSYRVDPIAIAFVFGLRSIAEIEAAFPGRLYETLTGHFTACPLRSEATRWCSNHLLPAPVRGRFAF
ncbi:MAG: hypothetical protein MUC88_24750 [Planctomycetes bacterium]|nr:hypothetical protein [Planctomycetota bacterium]